jgi:hypothetical protein
MEDIIKAITGVFATFTNLGWLPIPLAVSVVTMLALRIAYEPSILTVYTKEDLARLGWIKVGIFVGVAFITGLMQFGLQKPANGFDRALALGFSLADVMFAYVITSSQKVKNLIKSGLGKEADPEPPKP